MNRAPFTIFLDRDGVFNEHHGGPIRRPEDLEIFPGVPKAFARLNRPGVQTSLVTNQPWVGLGIMSQAAVAAVNHHLQQVLADAGGRLDHIEAALAPPGLNHRRRKPNPGMLEDAASYFASHAHQGFAAVDKRRAVMVGDKPRDAMAGTRFGIPTLLLATGRTRPALQAAVDRHDLDAIVFADLPTAVNEIVHRIDAAPSNTQK